MSSAAYSRRSFLAAVGLTGAAAAFAGAVETFGAAAAAEAAIPGPGEYTPTWASVDQHPPAPEWFQDAKFGIYFHWGVFAVPEYDYEWYPRNMYIDGSVANVHHVATYGQPAQWPYHQFITGATDKSGRFWQFAPKLVSDGGQFDPDDWAQLFVDAGAKFAGPVAEHHDGFSMWDSQVNEWNSVDKGPRLNLLRLFTDAIRAKHLKLFVAMHQAYHMNGFYDHVPPQSDPSLRKLYGQLTRDQENQLWFDKLKEVIDRAQPDVLYQDFTLDQIDEQQRLKFAAYYYNQAVARGAEVVATYKDGFNDNGEMSDYERGGPADLRSPYWLTDDSISQSSWSYTVGMIYYPATALLHALIDRVSKGGNMVLNISPTPEGVIPSGQRDVLLALGDYLGRCGASIYGTRAWSVYGEGPTKMGGGIFQQPRAGTPRDVRYTRDKAERTLYATVLGWPGDGGVLNLTTLSSGRINLTGLVGAELFGATAGEFLPLALPVQDSAGLRVTMPASKPFEAPAYVVRLRFADRIPTPGPAAGATAYPASGYAGAGVTLPVGGYTTAQLQGLGIAAASIASVRVAPGYRLVAFPTDGFGGTGSTYAASTADLPAGSVASVRVVLDPDAWFRLTNVTSGLALDSGGAVAAGTALKQTSAASGADRQWRFVDLGDGQYRLVNRTNGLAVDGWGETAAGATARQAPPSESDRQRWGLTDSGGGLYGIANKGTGLRLDGGGPVASGAPVKQWPADPSPNLLWVLSVD